MLQEGIEYKVELRVVDVLQVICSWPCLDVSSQHQPILPSLLDDLTNRNLALSSYEALPLALHQLLQVAPHLHLLHVGAVALPHHLLFLTQLLQSTGKEWLVRKCCFKWHLSVQSESGYYIKRPNNKHVSKKYILHLHYCSSLSFQ